jgi:DNA topoisomerase-1
MTTSNNKNLVLVESPAKAKTITKYLNSNKNLKQLGTFFVMASMGHVRDLKKGELGINIDKGFEPNYQVTPEKVKTVSEIRKKAAECDMVWLASDYDREGEGIAMHLKQILNLKKYKRITFTEITPKALEEAILNPRKIDDNLVDSQETRRILDRLVGFKLSPVLWKKYKTENMSGLSAGRVQSAVLHIVLQREAEIEKFASSSYWYYMGNFLLTIKNEKHELEEVKLYKNGNVYKEEDKHIVTNILKKLKNNFSITDVKNKEVKRNADLPFITSSLQQESSSKYGFPLKRTMQLAQELYEKGHITYMRTDSYNISEDFKSTAHSYIIQEYGEEYYSGGSARRKVQKNAQEAHEAIRPTHIKLLSADLEMSPDHKKLYDMIWKRTVAYFMKACIYDELEIKIVDKSFVGDMHFQSTFSKVKFNGYMIVYGVKSESYDFMKYIEGIQIGKYSLTCKSVIAKNTWQSPPQRYNESAMIKVLENEGIGRPSTYASIMSKLLEKDILSKQM